MTKSFDFVVSTKQEKNDKLIFFDYKEESNSPFFKNNF